MSGKSYEFIFELFMIMKDEEEEEKVEMKTKTARDKDINYISEIMLISS